MIKISVIINYRLLRG